jgi:hypothetical protein
MADQFATATDLNNLLQTTVPPATATLLLELSTSVIQSAVGQRIVDITDTAVVDIDEYTVWLELPQYPIRSVTSVVLDGTTITDWSLRRQRLWRAVGWMRVISPPSKATVTYVHGHVAGSQYLQLARNMCLSLAVVGFGNPGAVSSEKIDDYQVSYADAATRMLLTEPMREALVNAYGRSAYVTTSREEYW